MRSALRLAAGLSLLAVLAAGSVEDEQQTSSAPIDYSNPKYVVNYKALADEFEANSLAAESKYEGQLIYIKGPVSSVDKDILGDPYISITGDWDFAMIRCNLTDESVNSASAVRKGQYITVA
ncbi:MAG TPA: OB-fold protein, partial [Prochlorococcus sp.]